VSIFVSAEQQVGGGLQRGGEGQERAQGNSARRRGTRHLMGAADANAATTTIMVRCLYVYSSGEQCPEQAVEGADFCDSHLPAPVLEEPTELPWVYRAARWWAAALLLALILLQIYVLLWPLLTGKPQARPQRQPTMSSPPSTPSTLPVIQYVSG
jgi:hypothetical protein